ncbi:hypothetical protein HCH_06276 [Hahella chejuensis KCTC 2396]|uniref:Uncharacterized protein n=1 Tax=Hahella chejuensis (strain KCTC 2396) TaxID=349521 RepID=Q2S8V2_HAHCH|nr:hypothetical protein HCH_06276 [Hahella chejuensis KCTC 2396]
MLDVISGPVEHLNIRLDKLIDHYIPSTYLDFLMNPK